MEIVKHNFGSVNYVLRAYERRVCAPWYVGGERAVRFGSIASSPSACPKHLVKCFLDSRSVPSSGSCVCGTLVYAQVWSRLKFIQNASLSKAYILLDSTSICPLNNNIGILIFFVNFIKTKYTFNKIIY